MSTETVVEHLRGCGVVPVVSLEDPGAAGMVVEALVAGGVPCVEITFRHPGAVEALREARRVDGVLLGAGTVVSVAQAEAAFAAGADFAVAPGLCETVVEACDELGLPFFPGVATPSEIERARRLGVGVVKLFPAAQLGGPGFVRAVSAVYPEMGFVPTGGVRPETVGEYLAVPSVVACGGSWLVRPELVQAGRFDEIERLAREAALAVSGVAA